MNNRHSKRLANAICRKLKPYHQAYILFLIRSTSFFEVFESERQL